MMARIVWRTSVVVIAAVGIFVLVYIIGFYHFFSSIHLFSQQPSLRSSAQQESFCQLSDIELRSIVWSHRGRYIPDDTGRDQHLLSDEEDYDGSPESMHQLIQGGIVNFDVDVSLLSVPPQNETIANDVFVIAHPSMLSQAPHRRYQRVRTFLNQINSEISVSKRDLSHRLVYPFVTLEPKFNDVNALKKLLEEILETPLGFSGHVAVILKDETFLRETIHFYNQFFLQKKTQPPRLQPIAIAYTSRAQNLSKDQFPWRLMPRQEGGLRTEEETKLSHSPLSFKLIHMPDVQLLNSLTAKRGDQPGESFGHLGPAESSQAHSSSVSWIIDTEELLWRVVFQERSSDMIITNKPTQLLSQLKAHHHRLCFS
jgi:hypothetical protein